MKTILITLVVSLLTGLLHAEEPLRFPTLNTKSGKNYTGVTVREVTPSKIKIFHEAGITTLSIEDLPDDLQKKLNYDSTKASEHEKAEVSAQEAKVVAEQERRRLEWLKLPTSKRFSIQPARGNGITLRYEDLHSLTQEQQSKARTERIKDELLRSRIAGLPKGGTITVTINRSTIGAANSEYCLVIVTDLNGKEIHRERGRDDIAETPTTPGGSWWNLVLVDLPAPIGNGIKVRVVDTLDDTHADFTIRPTN